MKHLFDTDWIVDALRGDTHASRFIDDVMDDGVAISVVTLAELLDGVYRSARPADHRLSMRQLLVEFKIIHVTRSIADRFGRESASLKQKGTPLSDFDLVIAATALRYDLTLVTRNERHFGRVAGLRLLRPRDSSGT